MKVHQVDYPADEDYGISTLEDYQLNLIPYQIAEIFYWYQEGCYCGMGQMILVDEDGKYYLHDMSHCSCYGPTEQLSIKVSYNTLDDLLASCDEGYKKQVLPLVEEARKYGHE